METHENQSPAASITKLGIVRFAIQEGQGAPGSGAPPGGIIELPSFTNEESARPTVQMPPLTGERGEPLPVDEAFDPGGEAEPAPAGSQRPRTSTLRGVAPFPVRSIGSSPAIAIAAGEAAAPPVDASLVVGEALVAAEAPAMAAEAPVVVAESLWAAEAPPAPVALVAAAVAVAPAAHAPVLDDAGEELETPPRAAFAWWHLALAGGALATLAAAIGVAALT